MAYEVNGACRECGALLSQDGFKRHIEWHAANKTVQPADTVKITIETVANGRINANGVFPGVSPEAAAQVVRILELDLSSRYGKAAK